ATAARHALPIAVVVGNAGGWGIVRHMQQLVHGRAVASDLPGTMYERLADMAGGHGERITRAPELGLALENAFVAKMPVVLNVLIDPDPMHDACRMIALMFSPPEPSAD